jgi:protein gp37
MSATWAFDLRDECSGHGGPFFFKQWGTTASNPDPLNDSASNGKGGGLLAGELWRNFPTNCVSRGITR